MICKHGRRKDFCKECWKLQFRVLAKVKHLINSDDYNGKVPYRTHNGECAYSRKLKITMIIYNGEVSNKQFRPTRKPFFVLIIFIVPSISTYA